MTGWLIYDKCGAAYNRTYIDFYIEEGRKLDIMVRLILVEDLEIGIAKGEGYINHCGKQAVYPDFAICRTVDPLLSMQLELLWIPVFNNAKVAKICNNKARTYQYLSGAGIPMIDTRFCRNEKMEEEIRSLKEISVIKAVDGHGGSQVFLFPPQEETQEQDIPEEETYLQDILAALGTSDVVIQPLVGRRHQDLRVYVIGKEIIACVLRTAREGFKSNFSLGGQVCLYELTREERALAEKIIDRFDFGLVGIDFIVDDDGSLLFNEIEDVVGSRMLYQCSDVNIVKLYLEFIRNKLK